jgi:hypothetical protein
MTPFCIIGKPIETIGQLLFNVELCSTGPFGFAQGRLAGAPVPTWS